MICIDIVQQARSLRQTPPSLRSVGYGFLYWLGFLLVLQPANVLHAQAMGHALDVGSEAARICVAALLGASISPLLVALTRRFPLPGAGSWRNLSIHAVGAIGLAFALIVVSCFLASWVLMGRAAPSVADVRAQLASNLLLLVYAICAFIVIAHAVQLLPRRVGEPRPAPSSPPARVAVKTRGRLGYVNVDSIEWVESQGNYLALHVAGHCHLIRETLAGFERQLDPDRFVRIHRRLIVAIDRVREVQPLPNGDSTLILPDGRELRASRRYRETLRRRWTQIMTEPARTTQRR